MEGNNTRKKTRRIESEVKNLVKLIHKVHGACASSVHAHGKLKALGEKW